MGEEMDEFIEETGRYSNRSEFVRCGAPTYRGLCTALGRDLKRIEQSKRDLERGDTYSIEDVRDYLDRSMRSDLSL